LKQFKARIRDVEVESVSVIATSAVRDSANRNDFVEKVRNEVGFEVDVISGDKEAELGFVGMIEGIDQIQGNVLVIDIGGGSTELIVGDRSGIIFAKSLDVGAVRMTDRFLSSDPIDNQELTDLKAFLGTFVEETLSEIKKYEVEAVIGIGGTITTMGAIKHEMADYDREKIHGTHVNVSMLNDIQKRFCAVNTEERKKILGLEPKRADVITAGQVILVTILGQLGSDEIIVSEYDNLEGMHFASKRK